MRPRITLLWLGPSGYLAACVRELARMADVAVLYVVHDDNAAYDDASLWGGGVRLRRSAGIPSHGAVLRFLDESPPDLLLVCGWHVPSYVLATVRKRGIRTKVFFFDNQWVDTRQMRAKALVAGPLLRSIFDAALVPGPRQALLAQALGFRAPLQGGYSADVTHFAAAEPRLANANFLFVGRLVPDKGVDLLLQAYALYRQQTPDPWSLTICGRGPALDGLELPEGVILRSFVQPAALPDLMGSASAFVLPSRVEHWGVVLHEAAASGLPLVASNACGAVDVFARPENSWVFESEDVIGLAAALGSVSDLAEDAWDAAASFSRTQAKLITPREWAKALVSLTTEASR